MGKRTFKSLITSVLLAAVLICSAVLFGCGKKNKHGESLTIDNVSDFAVAGTTHIYNVTDTDDDIVRAGSSAYKIVISKDASPRIVTAAKDFTNFFLEATSVYLQTEYAEDVVYDQNSQFIVIGQNAVTEAAKLKAEFSVLGEQGFHIKTVGKSIFLYGFSPEGSQFAAYQLLTELFGFDYFGVDCYSLKTGVQDVKLKNYDITDVPDIGIRATNFQFLMTDKTTSQRLRLSNFSDVIIPVPGPADGTEEEKKALVVHNSTRYFPKSVYFDESKPATYRPHYYATDKVNICFTANGYADELAQMQDIAAEKIIECLDANPDKKLISMTQEDTQTFCECESCLSMKAKYNGSYGASIIIFLNGVAERVERHYTEKGQERAFDILFFAYHETNKPPVVYNEAAATYEPCDEKVMLNDHLIPYFAETRGDYTKDYYNRDSENAPIADNLRGWATLSKRIYFWMYSTNFNYYLVPYNSFDATQATYKFAIENKVDYIYDQNQSNQTGSATGWSWLKIYLYSKLTWNVNQDMNGLIDKFMANYFGPAAATMRGVFNDWRLWANYQNAVLGCSGANSIYHEMLDRSLWSRQLLTDWTQRIEGALREVASVKDEDYTKYAMYVKNISTERISYNYLLLQLFQPTMTEESIATAKEQMYHDQTLANIGRESEHRGTMTQLMQSWGII